MLVAALARAGEPEADVYASEARRGFARFAASELGQHMAIVEPRALVRVARGKRVAEVATSTLEEDALVAAIQEAAALAPGVPEDDTFPGFCDASEPAPPISERFARATAESTPDERVDMLAPVLDAIARAGLVATGALDASSSVVALATSHGLARSFTGTTALFKVWALESSGAGGAAGQGLAAGTDVSKLDLTGETARAIRDCQRGRDPISLPPGEYDVVLEPPAVAELVEWLGFIALGAKEFAQGISALAGRIGESISGPALGITEDPFGELSLAVPFDRDGVARRRVPLVEQGVARGVLYDRAWATRLGVASTGSASPSGAFSDGGPAPTALVLDGGTAASSEELAQGMERGLHVRRLHYVNGMLDPRRAVMTGLTRDGLFLVENGKPTRAVGNMRFTDSLLEAFQRCDGLTRARQLLPNWWSESGSVAAPAVRIRGLRFTGGSQPRP